jgi:hypothetical protein
LKKEIINLEPFSYLVKILIITNMLSMLGVWAISLLMAIPNCANPVEGNGQVVQVERQVDAFSAIQSAGIVNLHLTEEGQALTLKADSNLLPHIKTTVHHETLQIETKRPIQGAEKLQITVPVDQLNSLKNMGTGTIQTHGSLNGDSLRIANTGTGKMNLNLQFEQVHFENKGTGAATLTGQANDLTVNLLGTGTFDAEGLKAQRVSVKLNCTSECRVHATKTLSAEANGTGTIYYKGDPHIEKNSTNFTSELKQIQ